MSTYVSALATPPSYDPNDPNNPYMLRPPGTQSPWGYSATSPYGGFDPNANDGKGNGVDTSQMKYAPSGNEAVVDPNASMEDIYAANRDTINTTGNTIGQEGGNQARYYGGLTVDEQAAQNAALNELKKTPGYTTEQAAGVAGNPNAPLSAVNEYGQNLSGQVGQLSNYLHDAQGAFDPLNAAVNNGKLDVSDEDVNNITTAAGTTVGNQFKTAEDTLRQQAAAQGNTSPAAEAAMRQQLVTQEAATAGDEQTKANIAAKQYQLGALQQKTGMQATAATTEEAAKQAAAATAGKAGIDAANTYGQFNVGAQQTAEQQAAARAKAIADQSITGQSNYRSGLAGQQVNAQQGGESGVQAQNSAYGTQTSGGNAAASGQAGFEVGKASLGDKAPAILFGEGGTADEDMIAKVAEKGPEMIVKNRYRSNRQMDDEDGMFKVAA